MRLWYSLSVTLALLLLVACGSRTALAPVTEGWQQSAAVQGDVRVAEGDTLYSIAWRYGHDYRMLAKANHLEPPYALRTGQVLSLLSDGSEVTPVGYAQDEVLATAPPAAPSTTKRAFTPTLVTEETSNPAPHAAVTTAPRAGHWRSPTQGRVLSRFGSNNKGIDIVGQPGQAIYAVSEGEVVYSGNGLPGYGNLLIIKHNSEYLSAYAHNSRLLVKEGTHVRAGEKIAEMGSSGADRVKLHFELRQAGQPINPEQYIAM